MAPIDSYQTLVFDCDGVILNSNKVKTEAFRETALPYGSDLANALVAYHIEHGGVSRFRKFEWFLERMAEQGSKTVSLPSLLEEFSARVKHGLMTCQVAPGLEDLRKRTRSARWMVVSGGHEAELREVFKSRGLASLFDGGIYGSPSTKEEILDSLIESGELRQPALFLGDSKYDFKAANPRGLDFLFLRGWSELADMDDFISRHQLNATESLLQLSETV